MLGQPVLAIQRLHVKRIAVVRPRFALVTVYEAEASKTQAVKAQPIADSNRVPTELIDEMQAAAKQQTQAPFASQLTSCKSPARVRVSKGQLVEVICVGCCCQDANN
jgi:hypothetical protein